LKSRTPWLDFFLKEWLLSASAAGLVLTSIHLGGFPRYSTAEIQVLFILFVLFVAVKGLGNSGLILRISRRIETGRFLPLKLVAASFVLSMIVTNDVALMVIVPLTLALDAGRKGTLVILEALAANAGSALTPFGNPQNLFLYWYYHVPPGELLAAMAPFSLFFLGILVLASSALGAGGRREARGGEGVLKPSASVYGALLLVVVLTVLRVLPVAAGALVLAYPVLFDRKSLRVDYALLAAFFCFFGLSENLKTLLASDMEHPRHVFLFSALSSQIMSNVPAALLFAKFTTRWKALLWGVNVGGFGSLVGSLTNLIAYRLYVTDEETNDVAFFTIEFLVLGYAAFFLGIGLYAVAGS